MTRTAASDASSTAIPSPGEATAASVAGRESCLDAASIARRHAAGADPAKRAQILQGAARVFMEKGFDAASMEDVRRAAGVSKGTIYVYFADKIDLFEALIEEKRDSMFAGIASLLEADLPLREKLTRFGVQLCAAICSPEVVRAQRIVIGAVGRMPELGRRFHDAGPAKMKARLRALFEREQAAGHIDLPDAHMASVQFVELISAGLWRGQLFCGAAHPATEAEIERTVDAAVDLVLRAYGRPDAGAGAPD